MRADQSYELLGGHRQGPREAVGLHPGKGRTGRKVDGVLLVASLLVISEPRRSGLRQESGQPGLGPVPAAPEKSEHTAGRRTLAA